MCKFLKIDTAIEGLFIVKPYIFANERGYSFEVYNEKKFSMLGLDMKFVQENESLSSQNVLRGLHIQKKYPQGKLVRVVQGTIYDVAVDLRKNSMTFGKWVGVELSDKNKYQFYIPKGFAHGFFVKSEKAKVVFKVTDFWHKNDEIGIMWNDPYLNINWHIPENVKPIIAPKDRMYLPIEKTLSSGVEI